MYAALDENGIPALETYMQKHPPSAGGIMFLAILVEDKYESEKGKKRGARKHRKLEPVKAVALKHWDDYQADYNGKADFSRVMSDTIKREFGLDVKPDTIEDDWLPKTGRSRPRK